MSKKLVTVSLVALLAAGCAGRSANPVQVSQIQDAQMSCANILAEQRVNDRKIEGLSTEKGVKVAQNVVAAAAGFFTLGIGFAAMDFQDAAGTEQVALRDRNAYLGSVYADRCQSQSPIVPTNEQAAK